jgi:hypothetical protein
MPKHVANTRGGARFAHARYVSIGPFDRLRFRAADARAARISLAALISLISWCGSHDILLAPP